MKRFLAMAAAALALSACEARLEMEVNPNGSGQLGFSFVIEDTFLSALGAFGGADPFAEMKEDLKKGPVPFNVQEFRDNKIKGRGIRASVPFKSVEEMRSIIGKLNESGESSPFSEGGFEEFTLERRGSGWHFSAKAPAPDFGDLGVPTNLPGGGDIEKIFQFSLRAKLPGKSVRTTATKTEVSGGSTTFIWIPNLKNPKPLELIATTTGGAGSSEFPVVPVAAVGGGLAAAAIVAAILAARRKQPAFPVPADVPIEGAPPPEPGPPSGPPA